MVPNLEALKRRVDRYIWDSKARPVSNLRAILEKHFLQFQRTAIVGGLVRDIARRGAKHFKSDVDLVIHSDPEEVLNLARKLGATPNRFGGFSYRHPQWKIDFWALESTWAFKQGLVEVASIRDVVKCTFFDCDSIIYELQNRQIFASENYLSRLQNRVVEINLPENPSLEGNLLRAIRRIALWDFEPGPCLRSFISTQLTDAALSSICATERQLYELSVTATASNAAELLDNLLVKNKRRTFSTNFAEQIALPGV